MSTKKQKLPLTVTLQHIAARSYIRRQLGGSNTFVDKAAHALVTFCAQRNATFQDDITRAQGEFAELFEDMNFDPTHKPIVSAVYLASQYKYRLEALSTLGEKSRNIAQVIEGLRQAGLALIGDTNPRPLDATHLSVLAALNGIAGHQRHDLYEGHRSLLATEYDILRLEHLARPTFIGSVLENSGNKARERLLGRSAGREPAP